MTRAIKAVVAVLAAVWVTCSRPPVANACACCAEEGQRSESTAPLGPSEISELGRVRFAKTARLFETAAGLDGVKGISEPSSSYELTQTRTDGRWTLSLRDSRGRSGTLAFSLPTTIESFAVDLRDGKIAGAGGPSLYKEWRFNAPVVATGVFKPSMVGKPTVRLVLQGRGNSCTWADQFTHWMIVVSGPAASYSFFGSLAPASP